LCFIRFYIIFLNLIFIQYSAAGVSNIVAAIFMFVVGFTFLRLYNHWATQTILKKVQDPNYLQGKDIKFMMPVNQKARIDAGLNKRRTQYLLDVLSGMAVKIRRLEDDMAAIPNKKKPAFDQIPPEEVDLAERLQRLQKFMTLDISGAMAKSNAGLTKEALAMMRFKREVSSAGGGSQRAQSVGGSIARGAPGRPGAAAAGAASALRAKKSAFEVERASPEGEKDEVPPSQQSVFGMPFLTNVFGPTAQVKQEEEEEDTSSV
jgi:hypothetical protein